MNLPTVNPLHPVSPNSMNDVAYNVVSSAATRKGEALARRALRQFWANQDEHFNAAGIAEYGPVEHVRNELIDLAYDYLPAEEELGDVADAAEIINVAKESIADEIHHKLRDVISFNRQRNKSLVTSQEVAYNLGYKLGKEFAHSFHYLTDNEVQRDLAAKMLEQWLQRSGMPKVSKLVQKYLVNGAMAAIRESNQLVLRSGLKYKRRITSHSSA